MDLSSVIEFQIGVHGADEQRYFGASQDNCAAPLSSQVVDDAQVEVMANVDNELQALRRGRVSHHAQHALEQPEQSVAVLVERDIERDDLVAFHRANALAARAEAGEVPAADARAALSMPDPGGQTIRLS